MDIVGHQTTKIHQRLQAEIQSDFDFQQDEDFHEMEESARKIEAQYWQFFDQVIVNDELQDSCVQLLTAVRKAQDEPQWVPACWIRPTAES